MGQQQLLLLVLGAIIVGVAVVAGIQMFGEGALQANQDALVQDMVTIGSKAQEWWRKPSVLGGGGRTFVGLSFLDLNLDSTTINGSYSISGTTADQFILTGVGTEDADGDSLFLTVQMTVFADSLGDPVVTER